MSPVILLGDTFPQDIFKIVFFKRLFKLLLTGRIDTLPDDL